MLAGSPGMLKAEEQFNVAQADAQHVVTERYKSHLLLRGVYLLPTRSILRLDCGGDNSTKLCLRPAAAQTRSRTTK